MDLFGLYNELTDIALTVQHYSKQQAWMVGVDSFSFAGNLQAIDLSSLGLEPLARNNQRTKPGLYQASPEG